MKHFLLFAFFTISSSLLSQTTVFTFESKIDVPEKSAKNIPDYLLKDLSGNVSIYYLKHTNLKSVFWFDPRNIERKRAQGIDIQRVSNIIYFKDFKNNIAIKVDSFNLERGAVKYQFDDYNWEILEGEKNILGYNCSGLTTTIDGAKYTLWYSSEISVNDGPLNLAGVPGFILYLKRGDKVFECTNIQLSNEMENIEIPQNLKYISEAEFRKSMFK